MCKPFHIIHTHLTHCSYSIIAYGSYKVNVDFLTFKLYCQLDNYGYFNHWLALIHQNTNHQTTKSTKHSNNNQTAEPKTCLKLIFQHSNIHTATGPANTRLWIIIKPGACVNE